LAALTLVLATRSALAEDLERARKFFDLGAQAYDKRDYVGAVEAFEEANRLAPRPAILFSVAQANRRQYFVDKKPERLRAAVRSYREYLTKAPDGSRKSEASEALAELELQAEKLGIPLTETAAAPVAEKRRTKLTLGTTPAGGKVSIDGGALVDTPRTVDVSPGKHRITAHLDGYRDETKEILVEEGDAALADFRLDEQPALLRVTGDSGEVAIDGRPAGASPTVRPIEIAPGTHLVTVARNGHQPFVQELGFARAEDRTLPIKLRTSTQRDVAVWTWIGSAGAVAAGAVFLGLGLAAESEAQGIRDAIGQRPVTDAEIDQYESARGRRDAWTGAAFATWGVAAAGAITGFLLYAFDQPRIEAPPAREKPSAPKPDEPRPFELKASPSLSPTLVGATLSGRF
jgi:hypothetical protein